MGVGALRSWPSFLIVSDSTSSWEFDRNKQRENIMMPGVKDVFSDTFGLARRRDGPVKICKSPSNRANCTKCKAKIDAVQ